MRKLILVILLFLVGDAFAQSPYFQQYFLLRKNDPVQIESIFKDRKGFMWFGTNKGLFRFDGINTRRFTKADSLADEHVTALAQDSLGRIWIGYKTGAISLLENEVITKLEFREGDATQEISDILFASDGTVWFSTLNDGLYYYTEDRLYRLDEADGMPDIFVYDLEEAADGSIWAGTDRGVAVCTLTNKKAAVTVLDYKSGFPDNIIRKIVRGDDRRMWLATEDAGVFSFDRLAAKAEPLIKGEWTGGTVADFLKLNDEFWIATASSGVVVFDQSDEQKNIYSPSPGLASSCLFGDEEGSVWIGARNGLFRSLGRDVKFIDDLSSSGDAAVTSITVDRSNNIWFSNEGGLFRRSINRDGKAEIERIPVGSGLVISLYTDNLGFIWAGFYGEGAARIDPSTRQTRFFRRELSNGNVLNITGSGDKVWLATLGGAAAIDLKDLKVNSYDRARGLDCDYIYQVFVDSKLRTWFASDREGVAMLDESGFHKMLGTLTSKAVYGFAEDASGTIWANVQDDGLFKYDGSQFQQSDILHGININCLSSDAAGRLIAVHDLGLDVYDPKTTSVTHLDNEIGFGDRRPNLNSTGKDIHGNIFFGTDHGIVIYGKSNRPHALPIAGIDKFRVFNKDKMWKSGLKLAYNENNVTITFLGFWYQDPEGVEFQYKLDNYDVDWISTADRSAVFSSLPPGKYTFRLRASVDSNFEGVPEDIVSFEIRPPFWRTTVFYVLVIMVAGFAGYTFIRQRERNLLHDKLELEEKVTERTLEITKKNEEIQAQAEEIKAINESLEKRVTERTFELERKNKALEDYAFINAHNLRSPVASLLGLINLLSHCKNEEESRQVMAHMRVSAERLDEVVRSITESIEKSDQFEAFRKGEEDGID